MSQSFNDKASSLAVYKGPDYQAFKQQYNAEPVVELYQNVDYGGSVRRCGLYANITPDVTSSIRLVAMPAPEEPPPSAQNIHLIVDLYDKPGFLGRHITLIDDCPDLGLLLGFNNLTSSIKVRPGPNFNPMNPKEVRLFKGKNYDPYDPDNRLAAHLEPGGEAG